MTVPVAKITAVSAIAWIARFRAGRSGVGGQPLRFSCRYRLNDRQTMLIVNAMTPAVSVRSCGMSGQYGLASPLAKLATRADPIQTSAVA